MKPRPNDEVNRYFICDEGRANYRWINRTDRIVHPLVKVGDEHREADWDIALATIASALRNRRLFVLASARLSNEGVVPVCGGLVMRMGGEATYRVAVTGEEQPLAGVHDLALRRERAPNATGAALLGLVRSDDPLSAMRDGDVLLVADAELEAVDIAHLSRASAILFAGTVLTAEAAPLVTVALPLTNFAEEEGTFTNIRGRVQRFLQARAGPAMARPSWFVLLDILERVGDRVGAFLPDDVFAALARDVPAFAGLSYDTLGLRGALAANGATRGMA